MTAAKKLKAGDRQTIIQKIVNLIKKKRKVPAPPKEQPVLETLLHAALLENSTVAEADAALERLTTSFFDLNEIRVSSVAEIERALKPIPDAPWRALRIRATLHFVFEKQFSFDFEALRRKGLEYAVKQLAKMRDLSPFIRNYCLLHNLGSHIVPLDEAAHSLFIWLGLVDHALTLDQASEDLKSSIRKADVHSVLNVLRALAADPLYFQFLKSAAHSRPKEGFDPNTAVERLTEILNRPPKIARVVSRKKPAPSKAPARKLAHAATNGRVAVKKKVSRPVKKAAKRG